MIFNIIFLFLGIISQTFCQNISNTDTDLNKNTPDRSVYARKAIAVADVISDVYEVFVGPFTHHELTKRAIVVILPHSNGNGNYTNNVTGVFEFLQERSDFPVKINGKVSGLSKGKHGLHIYMKGDLRGGCSTLIHHLNPFLQPHGGFLDGNRHAGDLGNLIADENGMARIHLKDKMISLSGSKSILGRGIGISLNEDDLGLGKNDESKINGNSGPIIACGIIGVN